MKAQFAFVCFICLIVSACVQAPVYKGEDFAFIKSSHAIISVNGEQVEPIYTLDLKAGENTLMVLYRTYQHDYYCEFVWTPAPGTAYEITDHEKRYPLTLYRWVRKNSLWSIRFDPVDPVKCTREK
ncbi:hypothetical protein [Kaarinaea lacus]